jgi:type IX secretion system PorP/SprF family membrane protein
MKRSILIFLLFGITTNWIFSQVDAHFSLFEYTQNIVNPGASGSNDAICFTTSHRQQWMGMKVSSSIGGNTETEDVSGRPISTLFSFDMPITKINSGIGVAALQDKIGFQNDISIKLNYAYRLEIGNVGMLGMGIGLGLVDRNINPNWITWDPTRQTGGTFDDPGLPQIEDVAAFDMNLGVTLFGQDYWARISCTHLTNPKISFTNTLASRLAQQIYIMGGYNFQLSSPSWNIIASGTIQTDRFSTPEFQINGKVMYEKKFWFGLSGRIDAICPMVGMHLALGPGALSFGVVYDIPLNRVGAGGSTEIMARYCFNLTRNKGLTKTTTVRRL